MLLHIVRHMVKCVLPLLTMLFLCVLAVDESRDFARAMQDVSMEMATELEQYDLEWDEENDLQDASQSVFFAGKPLAGDMHTNNHLLCTDAKQSDSLKRGQVRRYAPRQMTPNNYNYILI